MKKINRFIKLTIFSLTAIAFLVCCSAVMADVYNTSSQLSQQMTLPSVSPITGDILVDNFEYWDDVRDHEWQVVEPPYPTYGYGVGYGSVGTITDFQEGSRVLDVDRPASIFLPFTEPPLSSTSEDDCRYMPFTLIRNLCPPCGLELPAPGYITGATGCLSFKVRAPMSVEEFDRFRFIVDVTTTNATGAAPAAGGMTCGFSNVRIVFIPKDRQYGCQESSLESITPKSGGATTTTNSQAQLIAAAINNGIAPQAEVINVYLGLEYQDGTWHVALQDLNAILNTYLNNGGAEAIFSIDKIVVRGNRYRLDDIMFTNCRGNIGCPYLYKIGPTFVQLFSSCQKLVFAEDHVGNIFDVITNPVDIYRTLASDSQLGLADQRIYYSDAPNATTAGTTPRFAGDISTWTLADFTGIANITNYVHCAPARDASGNPILDAAGNPTYNAQQPIPVLMDGNMRTSPTGTHAEDTLRFTAYIGGGAGSGASANIISPLPINLSDNRPLFLPDYYHFWRYNPATSPNYGHIGNSIETEGTCTYGIERAQLVELALANAGYRYWPNIAVLSFQPQVFEDLVVTVEVTNGLCSDIETFPVSVTNYPVESYPPLMEDVDDQMAMVNEPFVYAVTAIDPDSTLYCGDGCLTNHPKTDQYDLTFSATIAGLPSYQYGPWSEPIINPRSGLISFTPRFEGAYPITVKVEDTRGYSSIAQFTLFCSSAGTAFNHAPVVLHDVDHPAVCNAGELFVLDSEISIKDPDGDKLYYSCNIGSIGTDSYGNVVWSMQTQYPGYYVVDIVAMDGRGGYATMSIDLEVRPWWAF